MNLPFTIHHFFAYKKIFCLLLGEMKKAHLIKRTMCYTKKSCHLYICNRVLYREEVNHTMRILKYFTKILEVTTGKI